MRSMFARVIITNHWIVHGTQKQSRSREVRVYAGLDCKKKRITYMGDTNSRGTTVSMVLNKFSSNTERIKKNFFQNVSLDISKITRTSFRSISMAPKDYAYVTLRRFYITAASAERSFYKIKIIYDLPVQRLEKHFPTSLLYTYISRWKRNSWKTTLRLVDVENRRQEKLILFKYLILFS